MFSTEQLTINDPVYDKQKASEYTSLDETTIDKWRSRGKFPEPDLYLGRKPGWRLSTLNKYVQKKQQEQQLCG